MFAKKVIQDAILAFSKRPLSIGASEREYFRGYPALVALASRLKPYDENAVIALAYAAYGWMPTILKKLPEKAQAERLGKLIGDLSGSLDVVSLLNDNKADLQAINGSVVGVSKFLHFCVPDKIPIWDSRIGKIFGCKWDYQVNNIDNFLGYVRVIGEYEKGEQSNLTNKPKPWDKALEALGIEIQGISTLRKIELCLFLEGKFR